MRDELSEGRKVFLCCVAKCTGGSPGTPGAQMLITESGEQLGTIGGGAMEMSIVKSARQCLLAANDFPEVKVLQHRREAKTNPSGLICSGEQSNFSTVLLPQRDLHAVDKLLAFVSEDKAGWLTMNRDGLTVETCGPAEYEEADIAIVDDVSQGKTFRRQLLNKKRIAIVGGGHCGAALANTMKRLGFYVTIIDPRADLFTLVDLQHGSEVTCVRVSDFAKAGAQIAYPQFTDVVVMTPNYPSDVQALLSLVYHDYPFIGVMGSSTKLKAIRKSLQEAFVPTQWIDALHAPVGVPFNSDTPEEIAISVAAEILQRRKPRKKADASPATYYLNSDLYGSDESSVSSQARLSDASRQVEFSTRNQIRPEAKLVSRKR